MMCRWDKIITLGAICFALAVLGFCAPDVASGIEENIWPGPHTIGRQVEAVHRSATRICWTYSFIKLRAGAPDIWDFHLGDDAGNMTPFVPYRDNWYGPSPPGLTLGELPRIGESLHLPLGRIVDSFCVDFPSWVVLNERIRITGRIGYPGGPWNMWHVFQDMPTIENPPEIT